MIFCMLDTETTGLDAKRHEIIQVAAILCNKQLVEIGRTAFKIKPQFIERASPKALEVNGYSPTTWKTGFSSHKIAFIKLNDFFKHFVDDDKQLIMIGQNVKFDYEFLKEGYNNAGIVFPFSEETLDLIMVAKIWSAAKNVKLKKYSLGYLAEFTKQHNNNPHDAESDAEVSLDVLRWFVEDLKKVSKNDRKRFCKYTSIKI